MLDPIGGFERIKDFFISYVETAFVISLSSDLSGVASLAEVTLARSSRTSPDTAAGVALVRHRAPVPVFRSVSNVVPRSWTAPPPFFAATTNDFETLFVTQNNPETGVLPVAILVNEGDVIGILGQRATVSSYGPAGDTTINSYGTQVPADPFTGCPRFR